MQYIDMHCDTLSKAYYAGSETVEQSDETMVDIRRLRKAGAGGQFFAMFLPQNPDLSAEEAGEDIGHGTTRMDGMYRIFQNTLIKCAADLAAVYRACDLSKNLENGKISAVLTMENGYLADGKMENLKRFFDMGVRLITLTWNDPNCFGFPHSKKPEEMRRGLTDFGKEAVPYMNELGILVDVSHLSDGGFYDVAELSKKPFVASHSNCRALSPSSRNLTDEMIKIIAGKGGVAGINFEPTFLNADEEDHISRVERMCDHVCHMIDQGGTECAAIGTDFDGITGTFEIPDCARMDLLFDALHRRGISDDTIERIAYQNAARVLKDCLPA